MQLSNKWESDTSPGARFFIAVRDYVTEPHVTWYNFHKRERIFLPKIINIIFFFIFRFVIQLFLSQFLSFYPFSSHFSSISNSLYVSLSLSLSYLEGLLPSFTSSLNFTAFYNTIFLLLFHPNHITILLLPTLTLLKCLFIYLYVHSNLSCWRNWM